MDACSYLVQSNVQFTSVSYIDLAAIYSRESGYTSDIRDIENLLCLIRSYYILRSKLVAVTIATNNVKYRNRIVEKHNFLRHWIISFAVS